MVIERGGGGGVGDPEATKLAGVLSLKMLGTLGARGSSKAGGRLSRRGKRLEAGFGRGKALGTGPETKEEPRQKEVVRWRFKTERERERRRDGGGWHPMVCQPQAWTSLSLPPSKEWQKRQERTEQLDSLYSPERVEWERERGGECVA